jgi:Purine catabolism regulatory protein-like family.
MQFKEKIQDQLNLINSLYLNNAAGLVIKANRFIKEVPKEMIELADKFKIPIILIPEHIPYVEITHPILERILSNQVRMHLMRDRMEEIINRSELLPERIIQDEINKIEKWIKNKVSLCNYFVSFRIRWSIK